MVSNEEIKRRLELKRKGIDPDEESHLKKEAHGTPLKSKSSTKKMVPCPKCGTMNLESSKFCINCGNPLQKDRKVEIKSKSVVCPECGAGNVESSRFCIGCGRNLMEAPDEVMPDEPEESFKVEEAESDTKELLEDDSNLETDLETSDESKKTDLFEEIKKAKELLDMGAITEDEFEKIKNKYLKQFE